MLHPIKTADNDDVELYYCTELKMFVEIDIPKRRGFSKEQLEVIETYMADVIFEILNRPTDQEAEE